MDSTFPGPVRLCSICRKPFLKGTEASYNRHILYCRRTHNRPRTRIRSCRPCSIAKLKCDLQFPSCSRCTNKSLECAYDSSTPAANTTPKGRTATKQSTATMTPAFSPAFSITSPDISPPWNDFCQSGGPTDTEDSQIGTDWDCLHFSTSEMLVGSSKNTVPGIGEDTACAGLDDSLNPDHLLLTSLPWSAYPPPDECLTSFSGPTTICEQPDPNVLARVPIVDPVSNFTANIIMQMLCAFPQMMLRRETLPPFIHGHWYRASTATEPALPRPLVNCTSIAQVFASQNLECKPFMWNSIKTELQVANEKTTQREFTREDLLAAIQAQLIYMMMRVIDDSNRKADLNLDTYQNLCESFKELCNQPFCQDERLYPSHTWEDWIFAESRRRTVLVWVLIAQIVSIKIGVSCHICENYREIPLPSPKGLWEARTRSRWQTENEVYKTMPRGGLESFGDLIDACKHSGIKSNKLKLNAWNTTVDNLGMLLGLGAAILGF